MSIKSWEVKSIGDLFNILPGGTPSRIKKEYWNGNIPWVKISDMLQGEINYTDEKISELGLKNSSAKRLHKGTLLISIFATIGRTAFLNIDAATNQAIVGLEPKFKYIDMNFIRKFLDHKINTLIRLSRGVAQNNINKTILSDILIPLPPLPIQKQIAEILEKADKAKHKRQEANKLTEQFLQSAFIEMFGDPINNQKGWKKYSLQKVGSWKSGGTPLRANKDYYNGNIPWFSSGELNSMYLIESNEYINEKALLESSAKIILPNSILIGMYDTAAFKLSISKTKCSCNQAIAYSNLEFNIANIYYVYFSLLIGKDFFISKQRGVRQKNLNLSMIRETEIPLPPLSLQKHFAELVQKVEALKEKQKESESELENLFNSLMQKAFKGDLF
jgi:type I restriction enzyme S subunit